MTYSDKKLLKFSIQKIFKSAHNRRCTSSICIQTLCKVWIILIENCLSYRLQYVSTALLGRTDGRTEKAIPRPSTTQVKTPITYAMFLKTPDTYAMLLKTPDTYVMFLKTPSYVSSWLFCVTLETCLCCQYSTFFQTFPTGLEPRESSLVPSNSWLTIVFEFSENSPARAILTPPRSKNIFFKSSLPVA